MSDPLDIDKAGPVDIALFKTNRAEQIRMKAVLDTFIKMYDHQLGSVQAQALQEGTALAALELANLRIVALQGECKRLAALVPATEEPAT